MNYKLIKNFKDNNDLRASFNKLTIDGFDIDFEPWYQKGYWNEHYMPHSYVDNGRVVANASANYMQLKLGDQKLKAIQIGTVITDPGYRKQGLAKKLMEDIEADYKDLVDFFYLFADNSAMGFYEKCGYTKIVEKEYHLNINRVKMEALKHNKLTRVRKLKLSNTKDYELLQSLIKTKTYQSIGVGVVKESHLLNFYFLYVYGECIYYDEISKMILVISGDKDNITLNGILSNETVILDKIIDLVGHIYLEFINIEEQEDPQKLDNLKSINIEFKPVVGDEDLIDVTDYVDEDGTTFVKMNRDLDLGNIRFPGLSHA